MPLLVVWIGRLLLGLAPSLIGTFFSRLGLGVATYAGVSFFTSSAKSLIFDNLAGMPPLLSEFFGVFQLGTVINIWFSALAVKAIMSGLRSDGVMKKFVAK